MEEVMSSGFSIRRKLSDINIIKLQKVKKMNPNPYNKSITEFLLSWYHLRNLKPKDPSMYELTKTEILFASNKFIIENFENIATDKITMNRLQIKINDVVLFIFVISKRYFDFDKRSLLSFSTNFCKYNCPKIVPKVIKMNVEIPNGDIISSWINSGLVQIATSIIKQRFIIKMIKNNFLILKNRI
jgi:hypothetical protein